ncbi:hypothetical protein DFH07DRAFT_922044 [Mycena maculata]|uniref:Cyclochlorotine biosynthesis protein O n=1 Tax=Mycena maculata TaxID=230809 RepID=A0AAD7IXS5_9AGAR|nr:hypothetical protein DFH07DRAFT_922044 [Mycena maculata]
MVYHYKPLNSGWENVRQRHSWRLQASLTLSVILNLAFLWAWIMQPRGGVASNEPYIYSPAEDVVRHKLVKFTRGLANDIPIYERRPSPAVDAAWNDLWSVAQTKISRPEAVKMPNKTWPLLGEDGTYILALDVFHQLHCLDILRQQLHPDSNYTRVSGAHARHCIGAIRQGLMCSADITPIVWQWSDKLKIAEQRDDVVHVCRDYHRIRDWASERVFEDIDFTKYVADELDFST